MHLQRDRRLRKVGTQVVKWTTEGAVKEDTQNSKTSSILRREGIRQLPGICWYPVRAQEIVKQGGTAGNVYDPSLTEEDSVMGGFFVPFQSLWRDSPNEQKVSSEGTFCEWGSERLQQFD